MRLLRLAIAYESAMWRSLFRWLLRRPVVDDPAEVPFSSAATVTPILVAFIALSAVEVPILHLILPWPTVRVISLALGFYGLLWMIGLLAAVRTRPHTVGPEGLRIRTGMAIDFTLPWDAIEDVRKEYRSLAGGRSVQTIDDVLWLAVARQTSVDVLLRGPTTVPLGEGRSEPVTVIRCYADDPQALVAEARSHLGATPGVRRVSSDEA